MTDGTEHDAIVTSFASRARREHASTATSASGDHGVASETPEAVSDEAASATVIGLGDARMARRRDTASIPGGEPVASASVPVSRSEHEPPGAPSARRGWATLREHGAPSQHPAHGRIAQGEGATPAVQARSSSNEAAVPARTTSEPSSETTRASSVESSDGGPVSPWLRAQRGRDASHGADAREHAAADADAPRDGREPAVHAAVAAEPESEPLPAESDAERSSTRAVESDGPHFPRAWNVPMQDVRPEAGASADAAAERSPARPIAETVASGGRPRRSGGRGRSTAVEAVESREALPADADEEAAAAAADAESALLAALRRKELSVAEARAVLDRFDALDPASDEEIIARFHDYGYLDDARVAETLVETLSTRKRMGESAIARELRGRGLDDATVHAALESVDRDDEFERADELARDRARRLRGLDPDTAMRRLVAFLVRRGFGQGIAMTAASKALEQGEDAGAGASTRTGGGGGFGRSGSSLGGRSSFGRRTWTRDDDPATGRRAESAKRVYFGNDGDGEPTA